MRHLLLFDNPRFLMPRIELALSTATIVAVALLLVCAAAAFLYYRRTNPPLPTSLRFTLTTLRGIGLFLVAFLLLEPLLSITNTSTDPPVMAVLIDNSRSMTLEDRAGDRGAILRSVVKRLSERTLPQGAVTKYYSFGASLQEVPAESLSSLTLNDEVTDISGALRDVEKLNTAVNLRNAVLLTDGVTNAGENPTYAASSLGVPLFTVGIGDSTHPKDLAVTKVVTNQLVYPQTVVPVDVTVRSSGFDNSTTEITLEQDGVVVDRRSLQTGTGTREHVVRLSYTASGEGVKRFVVRARELGGEQTTRNNRLGFYAKILKGRIQILILAGAPSTDLSSIRQTLTEQRQFVVNTLTQKLSSGFYEGTLTAPLLDSADCIIMLGFPTNSTEQGVLENLREAVSRRTIPLMFIAGPLIDPGKLQLLSPFLPVSLLSAGRNEELVTFDPSPSRKTDPLLSTGEEGTNLWSKLPPVFRTNAGYKVRPEATILATARINDIALQDPLIATRNINRQRSVAILAYGLWRWRLMVQDDPVAGKHFERFLFNAVRWLTTRDDDRPVQVSTTKEFYTQGEPVEFVAQVYDAAARPVEDAEVRVTVGSGDEAMNVSLVNAGNGRFEGELHGLPEGSFSYSAVASKGPEQLGTDRGRFSIGGQNLEFRDTRMNASLLRQLAARTGGRFFMPAELDSLNAVLGSLPSFTGREVEHRLSLELWNWSWMLAIALMMFAVEWLVRKMVGLI